MARDGYAEMGAVIDPAGQYRYALWRAWECGTGSVLFVMLNPSTADASQDDPTINRCVGFARSWGYGRLDVANLFALRSSEPARLLEVEDPIGPDNDRHLENLAQGAELIVAAWGNDGSVLGRAESVLRLLTRHGDVHALRLLKNGQPGHPLYLPKDATPRLLRQRRNP